MAKSLSAIRYFGALGVLAAAAGAALAKPPEPGFWLTGLLPNANSGWVTALNKDGSVAAGYIGTTTPPAASSFTWTVAGGRNDFGLGSGMPAINFAYGLSDTGHVVGNMRVDGEYEKSRATRWTGSGPLQDLGVLPGRTRSFGTGISGDGSVVAGYCESGPNSFHLGEAFRWTPTSGMQGLGYLKPGSILSAARGVSRDGKTIVGQNKDGAINYEAFVWKEGVGMKGLPILPNAKGIETDARAANIDGAIIVGRSPSAASYSHAVRWVNGQVDDLTIGSAFSSSMAYAVSDDGEIIGGVYQATEPGGFAFMWSAITGMLDAHDYLAYYGVEMPSNYHIEDIFAVSGDGLTFGGKARNLTTGLREGFVATVPSSFCKADCDASGELDIDDFICFQTRFAISDPYADCDGDIELTIDDFLCFQSLFAVGC